MKPRHHIVERFAVEIHNMNHDAVYGCLDGEEIRAIDSGVCSAVDQQVDDFLWDIVVPLIDSEWRNR